VDAPENMSPRYINEKARWNQHGRGLRRVTVHDFCQRDYLSIRNVDMVQKGRGSRDAIPFRQVKK
jgi:predicted nuclease of restriction endonuclease-like (RecB) superfamily